MPIRDHLLKLRLILPPDRHALEVELPPGDATGTKGRRRAVVVGISDYQGTEGTEGRGPLPNARRDAEAIARILDRDFGFEVMDDGPLLDSAADLASLEDSLDWLTAGAGRYDHSLVYFAGHGLKEEGLGYLVPWTQHASPHEASDLLSLDDVVRRVSRSPGPSVIILDACYAGQALRQVDLDPSLDRDSPQGLGAIHLCSSGGPYQPVADGPEDGNSPFTHCLLELLAGRTGDHEEDGSVSAIRIADRLAARVAAYQRDLRHSGVPTLETHVLTESLRVSETGSLGHFRFRPRKSRLDPDLVAGLWRALRDSAAADHADLTSRLIEELRRRGGQHRGWDLPLALHLLLLPFWQVGTEGDLEVTPFAFRPDPDPDSEDSDSKDSDSEDSKKRESLAQDGREEVRARTSTAKALSTVLGWTAEVLEKGAPDLDARGRDELESQSEQARHALVHLAIRDPDPVVRHEAATGLEHRLEDWKKQDLQDLHLRATGRLRRRVRDFEALARPPWRSRRLRAVRLHGAYWIRSFWRHRWFRRIFLMFIGAVVSLYLLVAATYHLDADGYGRLLIRFGPPGFEAVWGAGEVVVRTGWSEQQLDHPQRIRESPPWSVWFRRGGWAGHLADLLDPEYGVPLASALGYPDQAWKRLDAWATTGDAEALDWASYLSLLDTTYLDRVPELARAVSRPEGAAEDTLRLWCDVVAGAGLGVQPGACAENLAEEESEQTAHEPAELAEVEPGFDPQDLLHTEEGVRSRALRQLIDAIEDGRADPVLSDDLDRRLAALLADRLPWNRYDAAIGILQLGRADADTHRAAVRLVIGDVTADDTSPSWALAEQLASGSESARLRLLQGLAEELAGADPEVRQRWQLPDLATRIASGVLAQNPEALGGVVDALRPFFGSEVAEWNEWRVRFGEVLSDAAAARPESAREIANRLLAVLEDGQETLHRTGCQPEHRANASLIGLLARAEQAPLVHRSLSRYLSDPNWNRHPGCARALLASLDSLDQAQPGLVGSTSATLLSVLGQHTVAPEVRSEVAHRIAWRARAPQRLEPLLDALMRLAADADPEIRFQLAATLFDWSSGASGQKEHRIRPWVETRLAEEPNLRVRVVLVALRGLTGDEDAAVDAARRLAELHAENPHLEGAAIFRLARLGSIRLAASDVALQVLEQRWRHDETLIPQGWALAARELGSRDDSLARRVQSRILHPMVSEEPERFGWQAIVNGFGALAKFRPSVAATSLKHLDEVSLEHEGRGSDQLERHQARIFEEALRSTWLEVAWRLVEVDELDTDRVARRLQSWSSWRRSSGRALLERMVRERPVERDLVRARLEPLRHSWRPEVRIEAARVLDALAILRLRDTLASPQREALDALLDRVGRSMAEAP